MARKLWVVEQLLDGEWIPWMPFTNKAMAEEIVSSRREGEHERRLVRYVPESSSTTERPEEE